MLYGKSYSTKELEDLLTETMIIKKKCKDIQKKFDFTIPDYVLEEIVLTRNKKEKVNLCLMINIAVLNNKLTKGQARKLKKSYC